MAQITEKVDVCVIGAGHAGCEAALACARMGLETVIFTVSIESIALMPCNPNIGGSSKGHLVRELDALGGEMGKNIDHTFIQSKMLNASKGPAVHSLRAQADKAEYSRRMRQILENQEHLVIKQAEVCDLLWDDVDADTVSGKAGATKKIRGVRTFTGTVYEAKAVILCTGTYLKARCLCGESITYTGPNGLQAEVPVSVEEKKAFLLANGIAVWDVIASCRIVGSSDSSIRDVAANDVAGLLQDSRIEAVFCNGAKSWELYHRYCEKACQREAGKLPSTSPANAAWSPERLIKSWGEALLPYVGPGRKG